MIIVSWSNVHGQPKSTTNVLLVSIAAALGYGKKCIITHTHFNLNNLETYLIGSRESSKDMFQDIGLDGLASVVKLRPLDKQTIDNYTIPMLNNKLTLMPGTAGGNRKLFLSDMCKIVTILLKEAEKYYDIVFVDANSGTDEITKVVLDMADVVIVNLSQNRSVLDSYELNWKPECKKKFFIIGSYDKDSSYNLHNLYSNYKFLNKNNVGIIPYNTGLMDAQSNASVLKYMRKNFDAKKDGTNGYFIHHVKKTTEKLLKLAEDKKGVVKNDR